MAYRYKVAGAVSDGTFTTEINSMDYQSGVFVIAFYNALGEAVTPTAGTIKAEMSPIAGQWHSPTSGDVTIDATKCIAGLATYEMPVFVGPTMQGRLTLAGVTGASSFEAYFWRI